MAKKTRRQKQRAARRPVASSPGALTPGLPRPSAADIAEAVAPTGAGEAGFEAESASSAAAGSAGTRRRIERVSPGTPAPRGAARPGRGPANAAAIFQPLESEDAAIPFDRVPYVPSDLRRVGVMAGLMILLIIIAAVVVSHVVT